MTLTATSRIEGIAILQPAGPRRRGPPTSRWTPSTASAWTGNPSCERADDHEGKDALRVRLPAGGLPRRSQDDLPGADDAHAAAGRHARARRRAGRTHRGGRRREDHRPAGRVHRDPRARRGGALTAGAERKHAPLSRIHPTPPFHGAADHPDPPISTLLTAATSSAVTVAPGAGPDAVLHTYRARPGAPRGTRSPRRRAAASRSSKAGAERQTTTKAPSSDAPQRVHRSSARGARTPSREFSTKWRAKRTARRIRTWRRAVRTNRQRREERDEFGNAPSRTGHQRPTARAGCERNPRTTAPSRTPTTTESAPSSTSRPERHRAQRDSETVRQSAGSPPRRTPRRAHRAYRPQNPRDQPGGGHSLTTTHRVSPIQTRRRVLRTRKSTGLNHGHSRHGRTRQRDQTRSFTHTRPVNAPTGTLSRTRRAGTSRRQPDSRAEQPILPEDAERTTISKRYDGTPTGSGTRRDAHRHEPAERTGPRTFRAHRTHLRSRQERITRDPSTSVPLRTPRRGSPDPTNRRRAYRPRKRAPPEKDRPPREQKAGIRRLIVHGTERHASLCRSGYFVLAALDLTRPDNANAGAAPHPHARRYSRNFNCPSASSWMTSIS